jgi:hypothetical protein
MALIYSPIIPRKMKTIPKQKKTAIMSVDTPGGVIFLEKVVYAIN